MSCTDVVADSEQGVNMGPCRSLISEIDVNSAVTRYPIHVYGRSSDSSGYQR